MKYNAHSLGRDLEISIQKEGIYFGKEFLDYAEFEAFRALNYRIYIDIKQDSSFRKDHLQSVSGSNIANQIEISMLGRSFDGFWEELTACYNQRSLAALYVEGKPVMDCEGDYELAGEKGRGRILLFSDSICILPPSKHAVRIPLCFCTFIDLNGYQIQITLKSGRRYQIGRMGYDTHPFAERAVTFSEKIKKERMTELKKISTESPFHHAGLFRTQQTGLYYEIAMGDHACALELHAHEKSATYLYRFEESEEVFLNMLEEAMEAMGLNRELIYISEEQIANNSLHVMAKERCVAVSFLRERNVGRLIHNENHRRKLKEFLK